VVHLFGVGQGPVLASYYFTTVLRFFKKQCGTTQVIDIKYLKRVMGRLLEKIG
jgi:hypothetical protein